MDTDILPTLSKLVLDVQDRLRDAEPGFENEEIFSALESLPSGCLSARVLVLLAIIANAEGDPLVAIDNQLGFSADMRDALQLMFRSVACNLMVEEARFIQEVEQGREGSTIH